MMEINVNAEVHFHQHDDVAGHDEVLELLRAIYAQGRQIMSQQDDALAAIKKIDAATTAQGVQLGKLGDALQESSDDLDQLILKLGTSVPADVLTELQAVADKQQTVSNQLDAHAEFAKGIAAKWPAQPPVPPTPPPEPPPV